MESKDVFSLLDELLPGLPNDVSLSHIAAKLPWEMFSVLSAVSTGWQKAIRSGLVYDTRVRSQSTETLVIIPHHQDQGENCVCLYSPIEKTFCDLLPIPDFETGLPGSWQIIPLDGKIYAVGGPRGLSGCKVTRGKSFYMLDLRAGQREWKKLANMLEGRQSFGCGVISGKIYVFGGISDEGMPTSSSEMYDPKYNTWSPIKAMIYGQVFNEVFEMGEELLLHGGIGERPFSSWQIYHPATDTWRGVQRPTDIEIGSVFTFQGNLYSLSVRGVHVYDIYTNSWRQQHSMSWVGLGEHHYMDVEANITVHANNELVVAVESTTNAISYRSSIIQSKGFSSEKEEILWEEVPYAGDFFDRLSPFQPFMGTLQL